MQTTATERVWMDYRSACEYTSYDRTTLWRAIKRGQLRVGGLPGSPRFEKTELDRWLRGEVE